MCTLWPFPKCLKKTVAVTWCVRSTQLVRPPAWLAWQSRLHLRKPWSADRHHGASTLLHSHPSSPSCSRTRQPNRETPSHLSVSSPARLSPRCGCIWFDGNSWWPASWTCTFFFSPFFLIKKIFKNTNGKVLDLLPFGNRRCLWERGWYTARWKTDPNT